MRDESLEQMRCRLARTQPDVIAFAPGRINLIGEHTDYNDGFVLPMAVERGVCLAMRTDAANEDAVDFADLPASHDTARAAVFVRHVIRHVAGDAFGFAATVASNLPIGAGLSSSAALGCAAAVAADFLSGGGATHPTDLAGMVQQTEHDALGTPCGIMDPFASLHASAGHALLLDCRSLAFDHIALPPGNTAAILIVNTGVQHDLAEGAYADRRRACEAAAGIIGVRALRDATLAMLDDAQLTAELKQRASHVITENTRVLLCASALQQGDLRTVGDLMFASHESLRSVYEVSCPELDVIVEQAHALRSSDGTVYGARMTGGGFGGCAVILARADSVASVQAKICGAFQGVFGRTPEVEAAVAAGGARLLAVADQESPSTS